jgi:predicted dithiol-disulfide oxidoreductase (DUF899 family)
MDPRIGTREEWLAARQELLVAEKEHTRRSDELALQRQQLPWVRIDKDYRFETTEGTASLRDLFRGRSQLIVQHFMFPGCPSCSSVADGYNGIVVHLENHDVAFTAVSRYPIDELTAYKERMGWSFPWASSLGSAFGFDFGVAYSDEQIASGSAKHNMHTDWDHSDVPHRTVPQVRGASSQGPARHERLRPRGRRRVPHLLGVRARYRRALGHVPMARPRPQGPQRVRPVVPAPRRVRRRGVARAGVLGTRGGRCRRP